MDRFVRIIDEKCNQCAKCVSACPKQVFELRPSIGFVYAARKTHVFSISKVSVYWNCK